MEQDKYDLKSSSSVVVSTAALFGGGMLYVVGITRSQPAVGILCSVLGISLVRLSLLRLALRNSDSDHTNSLPVFLPSERM